MLIVTVAAYARLMELLADEEVDEEGIPDSDDGELEGSGDDFEG